MENSLPFGMFNIHFALCIWYLPNETRILIILFISTRAVSQSKHSYRCKKNPKIQSLFVKARQLNGERIAFKDTGK